MKILIVYGHPNPKSFNHAIKELAEHQLKDLGHEVRVRDLYELGFDPVLSGADLGKIHDGTLPADIQQEQEHVKWADVLVAIHPIWWTGLPAIVKGYFDRVFCFGFAYTVEDGAPKGLLTGRKAWIINTTGTPSEIYQENGMHAALRKTSDNGIYEFFGMSVLDHVFFGAVPYVDDAARQNYLDELGSRIQKLFS